LKKNYLFGIHAEELVSSIQSVFRELSDIKKSLSQNESGPIGVKSAAQHLEVSQQKIYLEVEEGDIPHYQDRPGSKIYFFREELDQWVKEKKRISKKEILDQADNLKIRSYGGN
jgi:excisionase family DNA binding protein